MAMILFGVYIPHMFDMEQISNQIGLDGGSNAWKGGYVALANIGALTTTENSLGARTCKEWTNSIF